MSDAKGPGQPPSLGAVLGTGAGTLWRNLKGRQGTVQVARVAAEAAARVASQGAANPASVGQDDRPQSSPGSIGASLGAGAGKGWRRIKGKPGRNRRFMHGIRAGVSAFWGSAKSTFRVLFLELSGVIFLSFTAIIIGGFLREYRKYTLHQTGLERVWLAGALSAMFLYFGLSSFWRARRKGSRT